MVRSRHLVLSLLLVASSFTAYAQTLQTSGAQVIVPASGEITVPNDQARANLMIEVQDQDKALAASHVNQKMKQGIDIIRREDPQAELRTRDYFTYAIYADESQHLGNKPRAIVGWRVGQYLEMTTTNLTTLPKTIAAVQGILALNGLEFGLTPASSKMLDDALIGAAYQSLSQRIAAITRTMGRTAADVVVESVDFEGAGNNANHLLLPKAMMRAAAPAQETVVEPSFEPGESTVSMHLVGKIRLK